MTQQFMLVMQCTIVHVIIIILLPARTIIIMKSKGKSIRALSGLLFLLFSMEYVEGLSSGAPEEACETLSPSPAAHGAAPQETPVPYQVVLESLDDGTGSFSYAPGESYTCKKIATCMHSSYYNYRREI